MRKLLLAAAVTLTMTSAAAAMSGNDLHLTCANLKLSSSSPPVVHGAARCTAYIEGVFDTLLYAWAGSTTGMLYDKVAAEHYCIRPPEGATRDQMIAIVRVYLEQNPAERHRPAYMLIREALQDVWGCK